MSRVGVVSSRAAVSLNHQWPMGQVKDESCWYNQKYCRRNNVPLNLISFTFLVIFIYQGGGGAWVGVDCGSFYSLMVHAVGGNESFYRGTGINLPGYTLFLTVDVDDVKVGPERRFTRVKVVTRSMSRCDSREFKLNWFGFTVHPNRALPVFKQN
ncbi:hypothetical protein HYC85_019039 [Camellia sinensis]|uniref:Uncharacterized protein n=1 Tax=Camellia sinensis TaxID=4442 RepID=A0A7J7GVZ9_CAMSI|nr:hypothetical protein HYC85_019039 [Camellia sinensis]